MELIKNLNETKKSYSGFSKSANNQKGFYTAQIELLNYQELGYLITDMLKLCILALDQKANKGETENQDSSININLVLAMALQLFPLDDFELLNEINQKQIADSEIK
ncbi:hypothetical protein KHA98_02345 [Flavobacterium branchiicola]|nr:hypothetical protein [Flavobacterium branchiicola]